MAAGLQSFRGDGAFQIDGDTLSMVMVRKVILTLSTGAAPSGNLALLWSNNLSLGPGEIVALRPLLPANVDGSPNNGDPYVQISGPGSRYGGSDGGTQVECYVFAATPPVASTGAGVQVYRSNGSLAYDSGNKHLHPVALVDGDGDFYYQAGRNYAAIACNRRNLLSDPGGTNARTVTGFKTMVTALAGGIRVRYGVTDTFVQIGATNIGNLAPRSDLSRHLIVDVTNY